MKPIIKLLLIFSICLTYADVYTQSVVKEKESLLHSSGKGKNSLSNQIFVSYNYIHNLGEFGKVYEPGSGVLLNYGFHVPQSYLVVVRTGYYTHKLRDGVDTGYASFNVIPVHVGGRYYLSKKTFMPYFSFMNGLNIFNNSDYKGGTNDDTQLLVRYAFQVGFGFDIKVADYLGVNLNINFNNSFYDEGYNYEDRPYAMATGFEYSGGISYYFTR